jgi:cell division protein FtsW (lipid II flippase)
MLGLGGTDRGQGEFLCMATLSPDRGGTTTSYEVLFFIAMLATALALGGALAHAFELPNKIGLPREEYFIVQKAYYGWSQLGWLLLVQFVSLLAVAFLSRHRTEVMWPVIFAILGLLAAQAVFWIFTYPANVATQNWTTIPDNWESLRSQWEYSHLAGALFQLLSMCALIVAALQHARTPVR